MKLLAFPSDNFLIRLFLSPETHSVAGQSYGLEIFQRFPSLNMIANTSSLAVLD